MYLAQIIQRRQINLARQWFFKFFLSFLSLRTHSALKREATHPKAEYLSLFFAAFAPEVDTQQPDWRVCTPKKFLGEIAIFPCAYLRDARCTMKFINLCGYSLSILVTLVTSDWFTFLDFLVCISTRRLKASHVHFLTKTSVFSGISLSKWIRRVSIQSENSRGISPLVGFYGLS